MREAEDLVQETLVQALQSFHRFTPATNCRAWLVTILRHVRSNRRRSMLRHPTVEDVDGQFALAVPFVPPVADHLTDEEVLTALRGIPEPYQDIILLSDVEELSVLEVRPRGLRLADVTRTGGEQPISVTEHRGLVYVVHGGSDTITGFTLTRNGRLQAIDGSTRGLSGSGAGPAQIAFTPDGDHLMVTEKNTNKIITYAVERDGTTGTMQVQDAPGQTPFGFVFGRRGQAFVTEAFGGAPEASATSSFETARDGTATPISASVSTGQAAACWAALTPDGRFLYVTNTGSGSITGYAVAFDGQIERLDDNGRTGVVGDGATPIDVVVTDNGRYLYNVNSGTHTLGSFRIESDGSLRRLPFVGGLPVGTVGLASR